MALSIGTRLGAYEILSALGDEPEKGPNVTRGMFVHAIDLPRAPRHEGACLRSDGVIKGME
jgi:hypothetical protein